MTDFLGLLRDGLDKCGCRKTRILAAVSGGADSTSLLRGLAELASESQNEILVGHVDHSLRGRVSQEDAQWVDHLCHNLGVPVESVRRDVPAIASRSRIGHEEAARKARYETLERIAATHGCSQIALAHTADDQVETVLHHWVRGTGISGLRGMRRTRQLDSGAILVRPMLEVTRSQVLAYLRQLGQDYRTDRTNDDLTKSRNRIRQRLLPLLEDEFNPSIRNGVIRLAQQAADIEDVFDALCEPLLKNSLQDVTESIVRVDCDVLSRQPRHLIRECLARLWRELGWPRKSMGFAEWDRLAELCLDSGTTVLPGNVHAFRRGTLLILERQRERVE